MEIAKEAFIEAIENVKKVCQYNTDLNKFFQKNGADGFLYQPDCVETTLKLLAMISHDDGVNGWIHYFCFELDFGRKWKSGMATDADGMDIKLETAEDLYNYLSKIY